MAGVVGGPGARPDGLFCIAIDGPSGAGKSTVAALVATRLGWIAVDTGAMYRAVALKALSGGTDLDDGEALGRVAGAARIELVSSPAGVRVWLDGADVTDAVRSRDVERVVARVAAVPQVREHLVRRQREMAAGGGVVMEGRDIGSNVLPTAPFKFYLSASVDVRARRRAAQLGKEGGSSARAMNERDRLDAARPNNPLEVAPGAEVIESTGMTAAQVADLILARVGRG